MTLPSAASVRSIPNVPGAYVVTDPSMPSIQSVLSRDITKEATEANGGLWLTTGGEGTGVEPKRSCIVVNGQVPLFACNNQSGDALRMHTKIMGACVDVANQHWKGVMGAYPSVQTNVGVHHYDGIPVERGTPQFPGHKDFGLVTGIVSTSFTGLEFYVDGAWVPAAIPTSSSSNGNDQIVVMLGVMGQWASGIEAPLHRVVHEPDVHKRTYGVFWDVPATHSVPLVVASGQTGPSFAQTTGDYLQSCFAGRVFYDERRGTQPLLRGG